MTKEQQAHATLTLAKLIDDWWEKENLNPDPIEYDVGYWYEQQSYDMAVAAVGVLAASSRGQKYADGER